MAISLHNSLGNRSNLLDHVLYPANLRLGTNPETHVVTFKLLVPSNTQPFKPDFEIGIASGSALHAALGTTNLLFAGEGALLLRSYAIARLARAMGVPARRVGHASVAFNRLPGEIYAVVDQDLTLSGVSANSSWVVQPGFELTDFLGKFEGTARETITRALATSLSPDVPSRMEKLSDTISPEALYRFTALEAMMSDYDGYTYEGRLDGLAVNMDRQEVELIAGLHEAAFNSENLPLLVQGRGLLTKATVRTREGREGVYAQLRQTAANQEIENDLLAEVAGRAQALLALSSSALDEKRIRNAQNFLSQHIRQRFEVVRSRLNEQKGRVPGLEGLSSVAASALGAVAKHKLTNAVDYGTRFESYLHSGHPGTSSIPAQIHKLEITAPAGVLEALSWKDTNWIPVQLRVGGLLYSHATVRLKGHSTRTSFEGKPSFTLRFNQEEPGNGFAGQTKIHLQNARFDPSFLNQYIASWVFRKAGLPVARVDFGDLTVNGKPYGLFVWSEGMTKEFLRREFGGSHGNLYEGEGVDLNGRLELDVGSKEQFFVQPSQAYLAAQHAQQSRTLGKLNSYVALTNFARFMAAEIFLGHGDGYTLGRANYRVYQAEANASLQFIPHGLDSLRFDWSEGLFTAPAGLVAQAVTGCPAGRELYLQQAENLLGKTLDLEQLTQDVAGVARAIQPVLWQFEPQLAELQIKTAAQNLRDLGNRWEQFTREISAFKAVASLPSRNN